ncbi:hypothetical protein QAD02_011849 [Eretmocerus hayati]|uniref:Uncharacterized protein n=1 Tax=Eretmocerus hayati TaxID=131215 RepID=A0ACC2NYX9_9HYME|nr:hypothetical protein QAD02_011849 [Eretmocerus hayati]
MNAVRFVASIFCLVAVSMAENCKPLTSKQQSFLASKGIFVPEDYCYILGIGIYKLHEDLAVWNDARHICNDEGGRLAIINSKEEAEALKEMYTDSDLMYELGRPSQDVLLGFHDIYNEGEFVTILGQTMEEAGFDEWSQVGGKQPKNNDGWDNVQNCGAMAVDGKLDDVACGSEYGFICEISMSKHRF